MGERELSPAQPWHQPDVADGRWLMVPNATLTQSQGGLDGLCAGRARPVRCTALGAAYSAGSGHRLLAGVARALRRGCAVSAHSLSSRPTVVHRMREVSRLCDGIAGPSCLCCCDEQRNRDERELPVRRLSISLWLEE